MEICRRLWERNVGKQWVNAHRFTRLSWEVSAWRRWKIGYEDVGDDAVDVERGKGVVVRTVSVILIGSNGVFGGSISSRNAAKYVNGQRYRVSKDTNVNSIRNRKFREFESKSSRFWWPN